MLFRSGFKQGLNEIDVDAKDIEDNQQTNQQNTQLNNQQQTTQQQTEVKDKQNHNS